MASLLASACDKPSVRQQGNRLQSEQADARTHLLLRIRNVCEEGVPEGLICRESVARIELQQLGNEGDSLGIPLRKPIEEINPSFRGEVGQILTCLKQGNRQPSHNPVNITIKV